MRSDMHNFDFLLGCSVCAHWKISGYLCMTGGRQTTNQTATSYCCGIRTQYNIEHSIYIYNMEIVRNINRTKTCKDDTSIRSESWHQRIVMMSEHSNRTVYTRNRKCKIQDGGLHKVLIRVPFEYPINPNSLGWFYIAAAIA
jgi:hypothetical protein